MQQQRRSRSQQQQQQPRLVVRLHPEIFDPPRLPSFAAVADGGAAFKKVQRRWEQLENAGAEATSAASAAATAELSQKGRIAAATAAANAFAAAAQRETMLISTAAAAVAGATAAALSRQKQSETTGSLLLGDKYNQSSTARRRGVRASPGTAAGTSSSSKEVLPRKAAGEKSNRSEAYQRQLQQLEAAAAADETALSQLLHTEEERIRQIKLRRQQEQERQRQEEERRRQEEERRRQEEERRRQEEERRRQEEERRRQEEERRRQEEERRRQEEERQRREREGREAAAAAAAAAAREEQQRLERLQAPEQKRLEEEERLRKKQEEEEKEKQRLAEKEREKKAEQARLQQQLLQEQQAQRQQEEEKRRQEKPKETEQQQQQAQEEAQKNQSLAPAGETPETQLDKATNATAFSAANVLPSLDPSKPETAYVRDVLVLLAEDRRRMRETQLRELPGVSQEEVKALRVSIKKQINTALNQLASTTSQVIRTCEGMRQFMRGLKSHPPEVSHFFVSQACERLLHLTEKGGQISTRPSSVWAYAFLIRGLIQEDEGVERILRAHVYGTCCYAAPFYYRKKQGVSVEEFRTTRGQRDGEDEEAFFARMGACLRLWLSFLIAAHKEEEAWSWLARFLNLNLATAKAARRVCACVVVEGLKIAGPSLLKAYGKQFRKVMDLIQNSLMPLLLAMQQKNEGTCISMYVTQLRTLVSDYYANNCTLPDPEGKSMKMEATEASPDV